MKLAPEEIARKLLHLFALLMPIGIFYCPTWGFPRHFMQILLGILFLISIAAELVRLQVPSIQRVIFSIFGPMMRKDEQFKISGWSWIIGAAFLCSLLFLNKPYISFMALFLFVLGDAAAALVGISIGRIKIGKKSLEGSLACFITCLLLFYCAFPFIPGIMVKWGGHASLINVFSVSLCVTVFELIPLNLSKKIIINDNLAVPLIAGFVMFLIEKIA